MQAQTVGVANLSAARLVCKTSRRCGPVIHGFRSDRSFHHTVAQRHAVNVGTVFPGGFPEGQRRGRRI